MEIRSTNLQNETTVKFSQQVKGDQKTSHNVSDLFEKKSQDEIASDIKDLRNMAKTIKTSGGCGTPPGGIKPSGGCGKPPGGIKPSGGCGILG